MNRKIKFRIRARDDNGSIFYYYMNIDKLLDLSQSVNDGAYHSILSRDLFTGLKDKNGKEIYEGDIMFEKGCWTQGNKYYNHEGQFHIVKVETLSYGDEFGVIDALGYNKEYKDMEIIGNIYKNSDLLNQEESPELLEENEKENTRR